jgi:hypothetical protein
MVYWRAEEWEEKLVVLMAYERALMMAAASVDLMGRRWV